MTLKQSHRRLLRNLAAIVLLVPLSGCLVLSLQPVYDSGSIEFSESLLGTWDQKDEKASLVIARGAWNAYDFTYVDGDESTRFTAHLTRIGTRLVLDLTTATGIEAPPATVKAHWPFLMEQQGDTLTLRVLDHDWFKARLKQPPLAGLAAAMDDEKNVVITASTAAVRDWLARHMTSAAMWEEPAIFQRRAEVAAHAARDSAAPRETEPVIEHHFHLIRTGADARDETVYDHMTGTTLPFTDVDGALARAAGPRQPASG